MRRAVEEVILEKVRCSLSHAITDEFVEDMGAEFVANYCAAHVTASFSAYLAAIEGQEIRFCHKWPRDWWQHLKERFAPAWLLRRWPVLYREWEFTDRKYGAVCPHGPVRLTGREPHLAFLGGVRA